MVDVILNVFQILLNIMIIALLIKSRKSKNER